MIGLNESNFHIDGDGRKYCFCWCGMATWEGIRCKRHKGKNKPISTKQKRYSGGSKYQEKIGGYQQSGHS